MKRLVRKKNWEKFIMKGREKMNEVANKQIVLFEKNVKVNMKTSVQSNKKKEEKNLILFTLMNKYRQSYTQTHTCQIAFKRSSKCTLKYNSIKIKRKKIGKTQTKKITNKN